MALTWRVALRVGIVAPFVELESGRSYVMVCMVEDEDSAPPHVALGMIRSFSVE